jgi:hypothetical protein
MKFLLTTAGYKYSKEESEWLSKFGFVFVYNDHKQLYEIDNNHEAHIEINTLEELMEFLKDLEENIESGFGRTKIVMADSEIKIYDSYIE